MSYTVCDRPNVTTGEIEFIVVDCNGSMAPAPHGGPFLSKDEADRNRALLNRLSIEDWIALYPERTRNEPIESIGSVRHIAPDGQWIQHLGRNTFTVHPRTDFDLEIGQALTVDRSGEITVSDRALGHSKRR